MSVKTKSTFAVHNNIVIIFSHRSNKSEPTNRHPQTSCQSHNGQLRVRLVTDSFHACHPEQLHLVFKTNDHLLYRCRFALLVHRTGLINAFLRFNGIVVYWTFLPVSVCCPDIQAFQIKRFSEPLYCTTDLTAAFYSDLIMRLRLLLTVSVLPECLATSPDVSARRYPDWHPHS